MLLAAGAAFAGQVDVDGDGFADLVVEAVVSRHKPGLDVYYGPPGDAPNLRIRTDEAPDGVIAADVDRDGAADLVLTNGGIARILRGGPRPDRPALDFPSRAAPAAATLRAPDDEPFGFEWFAAGDLDGDGYDDVGLALDCRPSGLDAGFAEPEPECHHTGEHLYLWRGGPSGPDPAPTWVRAEPQDGVPLRIAAVGDVDGDGYDDLVEADPGGLVVLRGGPGGPTPAWTFDPPDGGREPGAVSRAGDLDGDGFADLLVADDPARTMVWYGGASGPSDPRPLAGTWFSQASGDLNHDGLADLAREYAGVLGVSYGSRDRQPVDSGWLRPIPRDTTDTAEVVAVGDVDGEGDDLAIAWCDWFTGRSEPRIHVVYGLDSGPSEVLPLRDSGEHRCPCRMASAWP